MLVEDDAKGHPTDPPTMPEPALVLVRQENRMRRVKGRFDPDRPAKHVARDANHDRGQQSEPRPPERSLVKGGHPEIVERVMAHVADAQHVPLREHEDGPQSPDDPQRLLEALGTASAAPVAARELGPVVLVEPRESQKHDSGREREDEADGVVQGEDRHHVDDGVSLLGEEVNVVAHRFVSLAVGVRLAPRVEHRSEACDRHVVLIHTAVGDALAAGSCRQPLLLRTVVNDGQYTPPSASQYMHFCIQASSMDMALTVSGDVQMFWKVVDAASSAAAVGVLRQRPFSRRLAVLECHGRIADSYV